MMLSGVGAGEFGPPPILGMPGGGVSMDLPLVGGSTYTNPIYGSLTGDAGPITGMPGSGVSQSIPLPTGSTYSVPVASDSNPFAGLSASTGLSATTLMLIAGGAILFFAMKK